MIDAFVVERMNLRVRGPIEHIRNTTTLEKSILACVTNEQVRRLASRTESRGLRGKTSTVGQMVFAREVNVLGMVIAASDVIRRGSEVGEVISCAFGENQHFVFVSVWQLVRHMSRHSNLWHQHENFARWPALECEQASAWYKQVDGVVVVVQIY